MNLILMGTNDWTVPIFESLLKQHNIVAVFTKAPSIQGRKMILQKSSVHIWAEKNGLQVYTDISDFNKIDITNIDFSIIISYGVILKENVINSIKCLNIHPSLLPKYRGASPIQTAILNGDKETGVCLIDINKEMDSGNIYLMKKIDISINDTCKDLENKIINTSIDILDKYLKDPNLYKSRKQEGDIILTKKFFEKDTKIDWNKSAFEIHNQIRSIGGKCLASELIEILKNDFELKIIKTELLDDKLRILYIQPSGKKQMDFKSFLNGQRTKIINKKILL